MSGSEWLSLLDFIGINTWDLLLVIDYLYQLSTILGVLANGLIVKDDTGDVFRHGLRRAKEQLAVVASIVCRRFYPDRIEALLDGAGRFVGGKNATARRDHGLGDFVEFSEVHRNLLHLMEHSW